MKIKFNLKTGLSLTKEETKEYLKVAGDVVTKLFSTKTEKKETGVKPVSSSCIKVRDHIPLEQGLRPSIKFAEAVVAACQRPYSIRIRIKTLIAHIVKCAGYASETIFH